MFNQSHGKDRVTVSGRRNWDLLVSYSVRRVGDGVARKAMADAFAALVSELTPAHREVLAAQYTQHGAYGRVGTHPLPPGLPVGDPAVQERWVALVLLDCVDHVADLLAGDHGLVERQAWRAAAEQYTRGAERYGRAAPH